MKTLRVNEYDMAYLDIGEGITDRLHPWVSKRLPRMEWRVGATVSQQ